MLSKTELMREPVDAQHHALERWVLRHLGSIEHERRVTQIVSKLFDLSWPLHGLRMTDRRVLRLAAIVHDVGRAIDDDTHPEQGARMLIEDDRLPLNAPERRVLAYLTRYHRGRPPQAGEGEFIRPSDDADRWLLMLALLRGADALDGRSLESPRLVFALLGRRLHVTCYLDELTEKARRVYTRRKKFRLLEELLDCQVEVTVAQAEALLLVA